jgi:nucleotide-binding universal stress UspA family protein
MMKVIVALDRTEFADQIIEAVTKSHWPIDSQFKLLTVLEPLQWQATASLEWNALAEKALERRKRDAHDILSEAKRKLSTAISQCNVHFEIRNGSPREEIITAAVEWMPDKIILGAHGHSPNRLIAGSVSRSVAQHARCSVELIRLKNPTVKEIQSKTETDKVCAAIAK